MASARSYNLLCPIARALDRVGDRWTLLILRDLHAGPARFSDLQTGLIGIAANMLTERLKKLVNDGLIERGEGAHGAAVYRLTPLGARTRPLLFELALMGGLFPAGEVKRPGNLRTVAVTLSAACEEVASHTGALTAELIIDGEAFTLIQNGESVAITAGAADDPEARLTTSYEPMIAVSEGEITPEDFAARHVALAEARDGAGAEMMSLLSGAIAYLRSRTSS